MTQKHDSRADVAAILEARRRATVEVQSIPALPVQAPKTTAAPAQVKAQSIPVTQPAALPTVQAAPTPQVDDGDVEAFLGAHLPALIQAAQDLARPPFDWAEVVRLGQVVSAAVAAGLPQLKGHDLEARTLVVVIVRYVWRTYATPLLPPAARPFAGLLESMIVAGIEAAYQLAVKRRK